MLMKLVIILFHILNIKTILGIGNVLESNSLISKSYEGIKDSNETPDSIKELLNDMELIEKENKNNFENIIDEIHLEMKQSEQYKTADLEAPKAATESKTNINKIDPFELTLKLMNFKEKESNKELNKPNLKSIDNNEVIFNHLYINQNGENKIPGYNSYLMYNNLIDDFILPEESKYIKSI